MEKKIQLLKEIRDCQLKGIIFHKFYTIDDSIEELEYALEWERTQLVEQALISKARQICMLSGLVFEHFDPEFYKSPLNPKNWDHSMWNMVDYYSSGKYLLETETKTESETKSETKSEIKTESPNEYSTILDISDENSNPIFLHNQEENHKKN